MQVEDLNTVCYTAAACKQLRKVTLGRVLAKWLVKVVVPNIKTSGFLTRELIRN
jgi:hypothetical protein